MRRYQPYNVHPTIRSKGCVHARRIENCVHSPPDMSCLLAKTKSRASFISRSNIILCNSCRASSIRARSFESMTKINPCVPVESQGLAYILRVRQRIERCQSGALDRPTRKVMPPQWSNLVLSSDIPDIELDVLVCDGLDVEADCGDRCDILVELELI